MQRNEANEFKVISSQKYLTNPNEETLQIIFDDISFYTFSGFLLGRITYSLFFILKIGLQLK